jgi:hypothetical protein
MSRSLYPRDLSPRSYWTADWVGPRAGLDVTVKNYVLSAYLAIILQSPSAQPNYYDH